MKKEVVNIIASATIVPQLAPPHCLDESQKLPEGIVGATVLRFGTIAWEELGELTTPIEAAGLLIDYLPQGATSPRRVAFGFNELGMWVEYQGEIGETREARGITVNARELLDSLPEERKERIRKRAEVLAQLEAAEQEKLDKQGYVELTSEDIEEMAAADAALQDVLQNDAIAWEDLKKELGL